MRRFGFTLIEVNLAMLITTMGVLSLVALYSFGYRENQQSNEDVQAAAVAAMNLNAMVAALSSTNMTWNAWKSLGTQPSDGWGTYAGDGTGSGVVDDDGSVEARPPTNPNTYAKAVFDSVMNAAGMNASFQDYGLKVAIVLVPSSDYRLYSVAVRAGRKAATLPYQALYYSEVCFQGLHD